MGKVYLIDTGALLPETDEEFEAYSSVYDKKFGYWDYNQYYIPGERKLSLKSFTEELGNFLKNAIDPSNTEYDKYFVVSEQDLDDDLVAKLESDTINGLSCDICVGDDDYSAENVVFSLRISPNGAQVMNFIENQDRAPRFMAAANKLMKETAERSEYLVNFISDRKTDGYSYEDKTEILQDLGTKCVQQTIVTASVNQLAEYFWSCVKDIMLGIYEDMDCFDVDMTEEQEELYDKYQGGEPLTNDEFNTLKALAESNAPVSFWFGSSSGTAELKVTTGTHKEGYEDTIYSWNSTKLSDVKHITL